MEISRFLALLAWLPRLYLDAGGVAWREGGGDAVSVGGWFGFVFSLGAEGEFGGGFFFFLLLLLARGEGWCGTG